MKKIYLLLIIYVLFPLIVNAGSIVDQDGRTYTDFASAFNRAAVGSSIELNATGDFDGNVQLTKNIDVKITGDFTVSGSLSLGGTGTKIIGDGTGNIIVNKGLYLQNGNTTINKDVKATNPGAVAITIVGNSNVLLDGITVTNSGIAIQVRGPAVAKIINSNVYSDATAIDVIYGALITEIDNCNISGYTHAIFVSDQNMGTNTVVEKITNSTLEQRTTEGRNPSTYASYAAVYVYNGRSGTSKIGLIENCNISSNAGYSYSGGIVVTHQSTSNKDEWTWSSIDTIKDTTINSYNGSSNIVVQSSTINNINNVIGTTDNSTGSNIKTFQAKIGNIKDCNLITNGNAYSIVNSSSEIDLIDNSSIYGSNGGISNLSGTIDTISNSKIFRTKTFTNSYTSSAGIYNYNYSTINNISNCEINSTMVGITNSNYSKILNISTVDLKAENSIGISNAISSSIESINNSNITTTGDNPSYACGIRNTGNTINEISDNNISGIFGIQNSKEINEIKNNTINSNNDGIVVTSSNGSIKTISNNTVISSNNNAISILNEGVIDEIISGTYIGELNSILNEGTLKLITGNPIFYGKTEYAIDNSNEKDITEIEPTLTNELQGYARYLGSKGEILEPEIDSYPTYTKLNTLYKMSTLTESTNGLGEFHYLTVFTKLKYDANGGSGDMTDKNVEDEYNSLHVVEENLYTKEGYIFKEWNTKEDGTGTSYNPGDNINLDKDEIVLYAIWINPDELTVPDTFDNLIFYLFILLISSLSVLANIKTLKRH